jgi:hypothetical protein
VTRYQFGVWLLVTAVIGCLLWIGWNVHIGCRYIEAAAERMGIER